MINREKGNKKRQKVGLVDRESVLKKAELWTKESRVKFTGS